MFGFNHTGTNGSIPTAILTMGLELVNNNNGSNNGTNPGGGMNPATLGYALLIVFGAACCIGFCNAFGKRGPYYNPNSERSYQSLEEGTQPATELATTQTKGFGAK